MIDTGWKPVLLEDGGRRRWGGYHRGGVTPSLHVKAGALNIMRSQAGAWEREEKIEKTEDKAVGDKGKKDKGKKEAKKAKKNKEKADKKDKPSNK